jgi:hypothetical protein
MLGGSLGIGLACVEILLLYGFIQAFGGFSPASAGCDEKKWKSKIVGKF